MDVAFTVEMPRQVPELPEHGADGRERQVDDPEPPVLTDDVLRPESEAEGAVAAAEGLEPPAHRPGDPPQGIAVGIGQASPPRDAQRLVELGHGLFGRERPGWAVGAQVAVERPQAILVVEEVGLNLERDLHDLADPALVFGHVAALPDPRQRAVTQVLQKEDATVGIGPDQLGAEAARLVHEGEVGRLAAEAGGLGVVLDDEGARAVADAPDRRVPLEPAMGRPQLRDGGERPRGVLDDLHPQPLPGQQVGLALADVLDLRRHRLLPPQYFSRRGKSASRSSRTWRLSAGAIRRSSWR